MKDALTARIVVHYLGGAEDLPKSTQNALEKLGIRVLAAPDRTALRKLVTAVPADALLVSSRSLANAARALPALRRLYGRSDLALIVLSRDEAGEESSSRILMAGADDVLPAPPNPALLAARIEAALRTVAQFSAPAAWPKSVLRTPDGEIALDVRAYRCFVRSGRSYREILLTRKQFSALAALLRANGRPVRWQDLFRRGWRPGRLRRRSRTLVQHVIALRRKLGSAGRRIAALSGVGYRLTP